MVDQPFAYPIGGTKVYITQHIILATMTNEAVDELLNVILALSQTAHEARIKIAALEVALEANPQLKAAYDRSLVAFQHANRATSEVLAQGTAYGTLRSVLSKDR